MSSQQQVEVLQQEIIQLKADARTWAASEQFLKSQLGQALRAVELAKKQLMLLEAQDLEIQSLRRQLASMNTQLDFVRERETRLETHLEQAQQTLLIEQQAQQTLADRQEQPALTVEHYEQPRRGPGPDLPPFLFKSSGRMVAPDVGKSQDD